MKKLFPLMCFCAAVLFTACKEEAVTGTHEPAPKPVSVTGVTLKESTTIKLGDTELLIAAITPENATRKDVSWKSSKPEVASVYDGLVTAKTIGNTVITVTTADGGKTAICNVEVVAATLPETMYLSGSMAGSEKTTWQRMIAVTETPGKFWSMQYLAEGDKMVFDVQGTGASTGILYPNVQVPQASAELVGGITTDANQNIIVGKSGWYIVIMSSEIKDSKQAYTLDFAAPNVYVTGMDLTGKEGATEAQYQFLVPEDATTEFEYTLADEKSGDLRIFAQVPGVDWWKSEFVVFNKKIEYRENRGELGSEQNKIKTEVKAGSTVKLNFLAGTGEVVEPKPAPSSL